MISFLTALGMLLCVFPGYVLAQDAANTSKNENAVRSGSYSVIIMQGNTPSASDCVAFENALVSSNNGYNQFTRYG